MTQKIFGQGDNIFEQSDNEFNLFSKPIENNDYYLFNDYVFKPRNPIQHTQFNPVIFDCGKCLSLFVTESHGFSLSIFTCGV